MTDSISEQIERELALTEEREQVTILYACESGSRAWGFESADSDYDVRFIYLRKTPWYLSIKKQRDVIEKPIDDELDISGWDVPKALELLRKSNPPLIEWLQSPIVYRQRSTFIDRLRDVVEEYHSPVGCMHHYLNMARNNLRTDLKEDRVWTKKYFYVLRPILACKWIEEGRGVVPIEFATLLDELIDDTELRREIDALLDLKRAGAELDRGPRNPVISAFIEGELDRFEGKAQDPPRTRDPALLDRLFVDILTEVNGEGLQTPDEGDEG